jgi:hypothetical protein
MKLLHVKTVKAVFLLAILLHFSAPADAGVNSCVDCHSAIGPGSAAGKAYLDWKDSVHDNAGVACDGCHGGDSSAEIYAEAHDGVLAPSNPVSPVHAGNVPGLCGECHGPQLKAFTLSNHFLRVRGNGSEHRGPTCVTCHGAMHTTILSPDKVAEKCRICHSPQTGLFPNMPEEAHATLTLIFYARNTIQWSQELILAAQKEGHKVAEASAALEDAKIKFRYSKIKWHSFNFPEILRMVAGAYEGAKNARELVALEVKKGPERRE